MSSEAGGPYVQMAVLCERALQEKDGVLSIIRVIDRIVASAGGPAPPEEMPPVTVSPYIVIMLKSGFFRGKHTLRVLPVTPSNKKLPELISTSILLEGEDRGVNIVLNAQILVREEGLYWFDVFLEDQLLTRIPMRILYQRVSQGGLFQKE